MSNGAKHKIFDYEVTPPSGIWDKIQNALDESCSGSSFTNRLKNFESDPPAQTWSKIAAALEGSSFVEDYAKRLKEIEVTPAVSNWEKIKSVLEEEQTEQEKAKKPIPIIRYAAAAAIIGLIAWGGSRILNSNNTSDHIAKQTPIPVPGKTEINPPVATNDLPVPVQTEEEIEEERNNAALEESKKTFARLDVQRTSKIKNAAAFYFSPGTDEETNNDGVDLAKQELEKFNPNSRYIVLMTPEGNIIRMSKKLSDLVCCVSGEIEEQDCVDQMKKWQEKMAYTTAGHSPGNFLEILNLVCSLEEE